MSVIPNLERTFQNNGDLITILGNGDAARPYLKLGGTYPAYIKHLLIHLQSERAYCELRSGTLISLVRDGQIIRAELHKLPTHVGDDAVKIGLKMVGIARTQIAEYAEHTAELSQPMQTAIDFITLAVEMGNPSRAQMLQEALDSVKVVLGLTLKESGILKNAIKGHRVASRRFIDRLKRDIHGSRRLAYEKRMLCAFLDLVEGQQLRD